MFELSKEMKEYIKNDIETTNKLIDKVLKGENEMYIDKCMRWKVTNVSIADYRSPIEVELECFMRTEDIKNGISVGDIIKGVEAKLNGPDINQIVTTRQNTKSMGSFRDVIDSLRTKIVFEPKMPIGLPEIKDVIFNDPATIVFWSNGTKTVVKCEGENFDPEKGLAMAISKKVLGNKYGYYEEFEKWIGKHNKKMKKGKK